MTDFVCHFCGARRTIGSLGEVTFDCGSKLNWSGVYIRSIKCLITEKPERISDDVYKRIQATQEEVRREP